MSSATGSKPWPGFSGTSVSFAIVGSLAVEVERVRAVENLIGRGSLRPQKRVRPDRKYPPQVSVE